MSTKAHIAFTSIEGPESISGVNTWLKNLLPELVKRDFAVSCYFRTVGHPTQLATRSHLADSGVTCHEYRWPGDTRLAMRSLLRLLATRPPDVYVPNCTAEAYYASRYVLESDRSVVGMLHSSDAFYREAVLSQFAGRGASPRLTAVVAASSEMEAVANDLVDPSVRVQLIPHGIQVYDQTATRDDSEVLRVVYTGRLVEESKHASDVARAMCSVTRNVKGTEAVIYGNGPSEGAIRELIHTSGLESAVRLAGRIPHSDVNKHLLQAHVHLLLSDYEGFGLATLEAMACGVVPICLRGCGGVSDFVRDGETGLLVNDRGDGVVNAIQALKNDKNLWQKLSSNARELVLERYSITKCADHWSSLLSSCPVPSSSVLNYPRQFDLPASLPCMEEYGDVRRSVIPRLWYGTTLPLRSEFSVLRWKLRTLSAT